MSALMNNHITWTKRLSVTLPHETNDNTQTLTSDKNANVQSTSNEKHKSKVTKTNTSQTPDANMHTFLHSVRTQWNIDPHCFQPYDIHNFLHHESRFCSIKDTLQRKTMMQHVVAHFVYTYSDNKFTAQQLYHALLHPSAQRYYAAQLQQCCPSVFAGSFGMFLYCIYIDQTKRFECVAQELAQASTKKGSPLHTLFATFSPSAQALSITQSVAFRIFEASVEHVTKHIVPSECVEGNDQDTGSKRLFCHAFQTKYGIQPTIHTHFCDDASYSCTVYHIDNRVIGESHHDVDTIAEDMACYTAYCSLFCVS